MKNRLIQHASEKYRDKIHIDQYDRRMDLNIIAQQYDVICFNDRFIYSSDIQKIGKKAFAKTSKKLAVKIPANKKKVYKKLFRKAGLR